MLQAVRQVYELTDWVRPHAPVSVSGGGGAVDGGGGVPGRDNKGGKEAAAETSGQGGAQGGESAAAGEGATGVYAGEGSRMVFIGRHLSAEALRASLEAALAAEAGGEGAGCELPGIRVWRV